MSDEGKNNYKDSKTDMGQKLGLCIKSKHQYKYIKWTVSEFTDFIQRVIVKVVKKVSSQMLLTEFTKLLNPCPSLCSMGRQ